MSADPRRLYISADIEGIVGVTSYAQTQPGAFEYDSARVWMTQSVVAAAEAAQASGYREVIVSDSHHNGQNILLDRMPDHVQLVRSWPRPLSMMQGIEAGAFNAAALIGFHTGSMTASGLLAHTYSGNIHDIRINGISYTETTICAAIAGHFGVPVVMVSGDDAYCAEARSILGNVEVAEAKQALGRESSLNPSPAVVYERIRSALSRALQDPSRYAVFNAPAPIELEIAFRHHMQAELMSLLPIFRRTSAHEVRGTFKDILEVTRILEFHGHAGRLHKPYG